MLEKEDREVGREDYAAALGESGFALVVDGDVLCSTGANFVTEPKRRVMSSVASWSVRRRSPVFRMSTRVSGRVQSTMAGGEDGRGG